MELQCCVQNYGWGKLGRDSEVARLAAVCNPSLEIRDNEPYAELWMGTHVSGPSFIPEMNESLSAWLQHNLDSLGSKVQNEFGNDLPFLFKVLSVRKALSIQAHPNKKHAEELHAASPHLYKDPNHKPELAIALTPFEALCGFRMMEEIISFTNDLPELQKVLGQDAAKGLSEGRGSSLKVAFEALMTQDIAVIRDNLQLLVGRLSRADTATQKKLQFSLLKRLSTEFPGDVGCWCIYFMNYLVLQPGQAIFLGPNVPHAYLDGDCVECMACSDNVVRAGLTPKYIDVNTLVGMLEYKCQSPENVLFQPKIEDSFTKIWRPPVKDFAVVQITIPKGTTSVYNTILRHSSSIILVVSGRAVATDTVEKEISKGSVLYVKASRQLSIALQVGCEEDLVLYQALCNVI